jgi:hypothetical protein
MQKKLTDFECAYRAIPPRSITCLHGSEKTVADLAFTIETEIDLIREGQDGTDLRNLKPLMTWLKKWAPKSDYLPKETL